MAILRLTLIRIGHAPLDTASLVSPDEDWSAQSYCASAMVCAIRDGD
jgi:hypothetical protein